MYQSEFVAGCVHLENGFLDRCLSVFASSLLDSNQSARIHRKSSFRCSRTSAMCLLSFRLLGGQIEWLPQISADEDKNLEYCIEKGRDFLSYGTKQVPNLM